MKTKFLLFLIIAGMFAIDISCNWGGEGESRYEITGIKNIEVLQKKNKGWYSKQTKDTLEFDSMAFNISFTEKNIAFNKGFCFINGVYADEMPSITVWNFDSIKVFSISSAGKLDVTNNFSISNDKSSVTPIDNSNPDFIKKILSNESYYNLSWLFHINTPPIKTDTCQFNFQFFDKKGRIFEKMSEPVVIKP